MSEFILVKRRDRIMIPAQEVREAINNLKSKIDYYDGDPEMFEDFNKELGL